MKGTSMFRTTRGTWDDGYKYTISYDALTVENHHS